MNGSERIAELRESIDLRAEGWNLMDQTQRRFLLNQAGAEWLRREEYLAARIMRKEEGAKMRTEAGRLARKSWEEIPAEWKGRLSSVACRFGHALDKLR